MSTPAPYSNKGLTVGRIEQLSDKPVTVTTCGPVSRETAEALQQLGDAAFRRVALADRVNRACKALGREIGLRRSCYPKWVKAGRMSQQQSDEQLGRLTDAVELLRELSGVRR